ncbi:caspase family protein [Runella sp. SP2]|uniref:caspase family protein n=1 Tax=Runella sp. SP2 TaxID=2268026 RepID=UPI0013DE2EBC|nr:caspase family protein [Runella sp. SP2]
MKKLLLLFLVSLFGTFSWGQGQTITPQPKPSETNLTKIEPQISTGGSGAKAVQPPKNYALLVGISDYKHLKKLQYADKDARDLARFLREQFGKDIKIDTLINDKANSAIVLGKLIQVSESNRYNRIFILISGHGGTHKRDTENGYLFTEDFETIELVGNTGAGAVRMGKLRDMMTDLIKKGMSIFLVVDACHAGSFYPEKISEVVSSWSKTDKSGIFLASQKEEKAIESRELQNGLLVHYFLKGSRHDADTDSNGLIWVKELGEYIAQKVPEQAGKVGHKQTPLTIGRDSLVIFAKQVTLTTKATLPQYLNTPASAGFSIPDSSSIIKEKLENSIKNKDLEGAYRWLEKFKKLDSLEAFQELKYTYVAACYNEAVKLSGQLLEFYKAYKLSDAIIRDYELVNFKRNSLNNTIDNILTQLNRSLALLSKEAAFYDEINYRKLVFEGHLERDSEKLENAIKINPDFSYPYYIMIGQRNGLYAKYFDQISNILGLNDNLAVITTRVSYTKPRIGVETGRKQGIYKDLRFVVFRPFFNKPPKRVGTLRVVHIREDEFDKFALNNKNRKDTLSIFKQIDGSRIEEGDFLQETNESGLGLQLGYGSRLNLFSISIGVDFRLSTLLKSKTPIAGIKVGSTVHIFHLLNDKVLLQPKYSVIDFHIGKDLFLNRNFDLKPWVGTSIINNRANFLIGTSIFVNLLAKSTDIKIKLVPEVSYISKYPFQSNISLRVEF